MRNQEVFWLSRRSPQFTFQSIMRIVLRELKAYVTFMIKGIKYKWNDIWKNMVIGWCQNLERMADVLG